MKKIFLLKYMLFSMLILNAQRKTISDSKTMITGHFSDGRKDTIKIKYYEERLGNSIAGEKTFEQITENGYFSFAISMTNELGYVSVISNRKPSLYLYDFLIKKKDNIQINVNTDIPAQNGRYDYKGLTFTGKNSKAFQVRYNCDSTMNELYKTIPKYTIASEAIKEDISLLWDGLFDNMEKIMNLQLVVLLKFKSSVEPHIYEILKSDYYYKVKATELMYFRNYWNKISLGSDSVIRKEKMQTYYKGHFMEPEKSSQLSVQAKRISKYYTDFITEQAIYEATVDQTGSSSNDCTALIPYIKKMEPELKQKFTTSLIAYLASGSEKQGMDSLIRYGLKTVSERLLQPIVDSYFTMAIKGSEIFPFELADNQGKMININKLKGKTVFIDFWFTGCAGCIQVSKALKSVKEIFKNDSSVAFVSISTDKDIDTWNEGLKSGLYTDKESINLYTMGKGQQHELIKYYHINGYPKLMLFDSNGKLFSFNAPRPDGINGKENLIKMINSAKLY